MVKSGFAQMAKGGLVMDVINAEQARIAQDAGVCIAQHHGPFRAKHRKTRLFFFFSLHVIDCFEWRLSNCLFIKIFAVLPIKSRLN